MATAFQKDLIPPAAASPEHPRDNLQIPKLPSSSVSTRTPLGLPSLSSLYNAGVVKSEESEESDELSSSSLWELDYWQQKIKRKSGAGTGNTVATTHATSGGSRPPQPLRAGQPHCGDVGGTKVPPENVIVISSDDESSDDETCDDESYDDESYDDESSDDESSDEQQESRPGCPPAPSFISRTAPPTNPSPLASGASAVCQPSTPVHTTRNSTAPATDATYSREEDARQKSDGRYRSTSHDHHGGGDRTGGSARRHPLIPDETGEPTENNPVRLPQSQERRASPSVLPDRQSISEPKPEDAALPSQYRSSPSAASKRGGETQHRSGSSALSQPRDHHGDRNQTNDPKQGDAQLPGDRGEQGVGSSVAASPVQEDGASIPQSSAAMSDNDRVLADVGPSVRPSASQDPLGLQQSLGRRPRSGTDVGENHRPVDDGVREHDRGDVTGPQPKRRRISTSTPAVGETAPKRQADPHRASPRSQRTRRPTTRHATPHRRQRGNLKPRSSGVASTTKKAQSESYDVEAILGLQSWYLVQWEGYGRKDNTWEPARHFDPQLLWQFYKRRRSAATQVATPRLATPRPTQLEMPKPRSAGVTSTTQQARRKYFYVEDILSVKVKYLVKWQGYGSKHNTWEPPEHFDPQLLQHFHEETGSVGEWIAREIRALRPPRREARRSAE